MALHGRGRHRLAPTRLEVRDPLGLRVRAIESDEPGELLVLPRIEPVVAAGSGAGGTRASTLAGLESGTAMNQIDARAIELEVDGLRAYRDGSPASRIHWPAVARTGELIERNLVSGADAAPLVVLDSTQPDSPAALDAAVRAAASLCVHLAANGGCAALLPDERRPTEIERDMRSWPQVHARLALVEPSERAADAAADAALGRGLPGQRPRRGPAPRRPSAAARERVSWSRPQSTWKGAAAFTVAGCVGRRVGRAGRRAGGAGGVSDRHGPRRLDRDRPAPPPRRSRAVEPAREAPAGYEIAVFGLLGLFVAAQWARLMIDPPLGRMFAALAAICLGGWVLREIATRGDGRRRARLAAWAAALVTVLGALVIAGLAGEAARCPSTGASSATGSAPASPRSRRSTSRTAAPSRTSG